MSLSKAEAELRMPVMEIFGPTLQGEGELIGVRTFFIRFGGCDYKCRWCDSMHAVLPEQVKRNAELLNAAEIMEVIANISHASNGAYATRWVTLSGGNPAMQKHMAPLIRELHQKGFKVAIETQGTIKHDWADMCDLITLSPKPPSSGHAIEYTQLDSWVHNVNAMKVLKIVVAGLEDLLFAKAVIDRYPNLKAFIQPMTELTNDIIATRQQICDQLVWLHEFSVKYEVDAIILPQMHTLMWGQEKGK